MTIATKIETKRDNKTRETQFFISDFQGRLINDTGKVTRSYMSIVTAVQSTT